MPSPIVKLRSLYSTVLFLAMLALLQTTTAPAQAGYYYAWGNIRGGSCMEVAVKRHDATYGASPYGYTDYQEYTAGGCTIYSVGPNGGKAWVGVADFTCDDDPYTKRINGVCVPFSPPSCSAGTGAGGPAPTGGNPIAALGRSKHEHVVDFATGGAAALTFERFYGRVGEGFSRANDYSRLGMKWRTNFDAMMNSPDSGTTLIITLPDGFDLVFYLTSGTYVEKEYLITPPAFGGTGYAELKTRLGTHNSLVKVGADFKLTTADDRVWTFDASYRLTQIAYRGGYIQTLAYDAAGNNTGVTDNLGRSITMTYNSGGLLTQATMPDGSVFAFSYKSVMDPAMAVPANGWPMIKQARVLETVQQVGVAQSTTTYLYENSSFAAALTGITDARGIRYATFGYDTLGRAVSTQHDGGVDLFAFDYDLANKKAKITNPLGKVTTYTYGISSSGRARVTTVTGEPSSNCPISTGTYTYDANNFVATQTDEEGRVTSYVNNAKGQPTSVTRGYGTPQAVTTSYTYHATYRVPTQMVEPGLTTNYTWDANGRMTALAQVDTTTTTVPYSTNGQTRTTTYTYTGAAGLLASVDGPLAGTGDTVSYTYNANGYVATVTNQVGHVTTINAVNGRGQPTQITDANGIVTNLGYDLQGRLTSTTVNPGAGQAVTTIAYDAIGNVTGITRPDGSSFTYSFDNARRLTAVTALDGQKTEYAYDLMGNRTGATIKNASNVATFAQTAMFDELGRLLKSIGANTQTTTYAYEKNDNLKTVTDPRSNLYSYAYDSLNRLIRETDQDNAQVNLTRNGRDEITNYADPRSLSTSYVRNGFGEVIRETSPDRGTTDTVRDARGLATQVTDGRGVVTNLTYDNAGRILTKAYPAATAENVTYTYDSTAGGNLGLGRLTGLTSQNVTIARIYDARGNVTSETRTIAGQPHTIAYAYDAADQVSQVTYPSGRIVAYARDSMGRIVTVTTRKTSLDSPVTLASQLTYRPLSRLLDGFSYGNGLTETNTWTLDYELGRCQVADGATLLIDRTLGRADALNLTSVTDNLLAANSEAFGYSAANRLNAASGPYGAYSWTYDLVGNRTSEGLTPPGGSLATDSYGYPGTSNRIQSITRGGATVRQITYDNAGNTLTDNRAGTTTTYTYNMRNRLASATSGALVWGYTYNGLEQLAVRTLTTGGTDVTHFIHDLAGNVIAETNGTGPSGTLREYIWLPEVTIAPTKDSRTTIDRPLAVIEDVETASPLTWWVSVDHLNRPVKMTNASKASVWDAVWQPWGGVHSITGSGAFNLRFPGQWFQLEAGLHYNWHRHYDPTLGRYTQPDPLGFVDGPSVYGYAKGSPLRYVDASGRDVDVMGDAIVIWYLSRVSYGLCRAAVRTIVKAAFSRVTPETCSQDEHDRRQDEINRSCKPEPGKCKSGPDLQRAAQARYCAMLRQQQLSRCFGESGGDDGHRRKIQDFWEAYASCQ